MNNFTTGNKTVDEIGSFHLEGNIIPHTWYSHLKLESGKTDLISLILLSEIVYWYRPVYVKDETSGILKGMKKRFKSDLLQRSYDSFVEQFGLTKRQVKDAFKRLEDAGVIKRVFRTIDAGNTRLGNVLFIELNVEKVKVMTFESAPCNVRTSEGVTKESDTYDVKTSDLLRQNGAPMTLKRQTNTEITTEITTDIKKEDEEASAHDPVNNPFRFYEQNGFGTIGSHIAEKIVAWCEDLSDELVLYAMTIAVEQGKCTWRYVEAILTDWSQKKLGSVDQVKAAQLAYKQQQSQKRQSNGHRSYGRPIREEILPQWFVEEKEQSTPSKEAEESTKTVADRNAEIEFEEKRKALEERLKNRRLNQQHNKGE
ncbi:DnaD domain protein [Pseudobacillus badius]|uniref:DnaD domain protein n=1 Tax=Bacillus badius TaxID=1455 RepID=UPI0024A13F9B|nr:DnaD domain protein [Bacillus badius]GLY09572.1 hypothetical protein Bbad01_07880 [Bacillus badius]